jgi:hypothetical protein
VEAVRMIIETSRNQVRGAADGDSTTWNCVNNIRMLSTGPKQSIRDHPLLPHCAAIPISRTRSDFDEG